MSVVLFILVLIVSFGMLLYFLRPTATETAVQQHLAHIEGSREGEGDSATILKRDALSSAPWLDELIRGLPITQAIARLIKQAGQKWQVSSVLLFSLISGLCGAWLASFVIPIDALS